MTEHAARRPQNEVSLLLIFQFADSRVRSIVA